MCLVQNGWNSRGTDSCGPKESCFRWECTLTPPGKYCRSIFVEVAMWLYVKLVWPLVCLFSFNFHDWWGAGVAICLECGPDCLHMVHLIPLYLKTPPSLASFKSRLVFTARCYASAVLAMALCLSVRLSVTSRSSTKTAKCRITQTTSHDSPGTLVFGCQRSPRHSTGITPCGGAKYRWGGSKSATFDK